MATELEQYVLDHISAEDPVLTELDRKTHFRVIQPRMLSGHLQGQMLEMLTKLIRPRCVLELGTFTGYSAIAIARGMEGQGEGVVHTIEINDELEDFTSEYIERAGVRDRIVQHIAPALEVVPTLGLVFDMVFIDADKREYPAYYRMLLDGGLVRSGSVILADNVLWGGKVVEPVAHNDLHTQAVMEFNKMVREDDRVEKVILPLRDGMTVIRVK